LNPLERKAAKAYRDIMGDDAILYFEGISMHDLVDKLIKFLEEKIRDETHESK
jgi:hypothetical protein